MKMVIRHWSLMLAALLLAASIVQGQIDPVKNFAYTTVSTGYDASATTVVLTSGGAAKFPDPSSDGAFNVIWFNATDYPGAFNDPNVEIVRVTNDPSTDTWTVTRAQEGTSAATHNTGGKTYAMMNDFTKKSIDDVRTYLATILTSTGIDANRILYGASTIAVTAEAAFNYNPSTNTFTADNITSTGTQVLGTISAGLWNGTIITSGFGGTGNGFTKFTGPTTSEKTFTLPNASATILTNNTAVTVGQGGTGASTSYAAYDALTTHGADVASATTTDLDAATGELVDVTGTTTITAITLANGRQRTVRFTGALTLTHGSSLVLPGSANITTVAGDVAIFRGYASSVVRCVSYSPITVTGTGSAVRGTGPAITLVNATGLALSTGVSGTLPVGNGGTGQTSFTDGQLLIGNSTGNTLTKASLTAGSGISITPSGGGITIAATGGGGGTTEPIQLTPLDAFFPSTNFPQLTTTHATVRRPVLGYDATTDETAYFYVPYAPSWFSSGAITATINFICVSDNNTAHNAYFSVAIEAVTSSDATDLDAASSFDTANSGNTTILGTAGYMKQLSITLTNKDGVAEGDGVIISVTTVNASADVTGDIQITGLSIHP